MVDTNLECCCDDRLLFPEIFKFHGVDVKTLVGERARKLFMLMQKVPDSEWVQRVGW